MGKTRYDYFDYTDILQSELDTKNLVAVTIDNNIVIYWKDVTIPFIFFKETINGDITLRVESGPFRKIKYITGCITKFGIIFCQSVLSDNSLYDYCNECEII